MIYQVKFKDMSSKEAIDIMSSFGTFCIINQIFFLQTNNSDFYKINSDKIQQFVSITNNNYSLIENEVARNWCKQKLTEEEMDNFEKSPECQARLEAIMGYLDLLERAKKEGGAVGTKKNNHKASTKRAAANTGGSSKNNQGSRESVD